MKFTSSTLEDRQGYRPSDCFETFPFPDCWDVDPALESIGRAYDTFLADLMIRHNEGLTKTYNRFHDPDETSPDILRLRELHTAMDRAVLDAYGWTDIPTDCDFFLEWEDEDDVDTPGPASGGRGGKGRKKPWRLRWPDAIRDEVLARLLALNAERAAEEEREGLAASAHKAKPRGKKRPSGPDLFDALI